MLRLRSLQGATSLSDVARLLHFEPKGLSYILYFQPDADKYRHFEIPKRNGGLRPIDAPQGGLKLLQRRLADLLQDCVEEITVASQRKDRTAHGFKRDRSIVTNARKHRRRRFVLNLDLEGFFPSINFGRIRGYFLKNRDFQLQAPVATVLAQIACCGNFLPQGSPCSPVISNLIAQPLDIRLLRLASKTRVTYSRYADDLSFSTNDRDFPAEIAVPLDGTAPFTWIAGERLRAIVERSGFRIQAEKTRLMFRGSRQEVTGLVVNERINVRQSYRREVRAMVHSLVRKGSFEMLGVAKGEPPTVAKRSGSLDELHGRLGFIDSIDMSRDLPVAGFEQVYRDFLMYKLFVAASCPTVICEGPTDNVYLTHAFRSLAGEFPVLAIVNGGKVQLKVRLFKYPESSTGRLLGLKNGGSALVAGFIADYRKRTERITAPGLRHPVIVVYDNDDGAKPIRNAIKQTNKTEVKGSEPYVHIHKNLYAVPTPFSNDGKHTCIEDFFDEATRATIIGGKTFCPGDGFDGTKHYGKKVFAHQVVRPNADKLYFGRFRQLVANIVSVIAAHEEAIADRAL